MMHVLALSLFGWLAGWLAVDADEIRVQSQHRLHIIAQKGYVQEFSVFECGLRSKRARFYSCISFASNHLSNHHEYCYALLYLLVVEMA